MKAATCGAAAAAVTIAMSASAPALTSPRVTTSEERPESAAATLYLLVRFLTP